LKYLENLLEIVLFNTGSVVGDIELPEAVLFDTTNSYRAILCMQNPSVSGSRTRVFLRSSACRFHFKRYGLRRFVEIKHHQPAVSGSFSIGRIFSFSVFILSSLYSFARCKPVLLHFSHLLAELLQISGLPYVVLLFDLDFVSFAPIAFAFTG
jgi:hypothetical protein